MNIKSLFVLLIVVMLVSTVYVEIANSSTVYYFGKGTVGASGATSANGEIMLSKFTCNRTSTITDMIIYIKTSSSNIVVPVIYSDNSGSPQTLLAYGVPQTITSTTQSWVTFIGFNLPVTNTNVYWLGFALNSAGGSTITFYYDSAGAGSEVYTTYTPPNIPTTISSSTPQALSFSVYVAMSEPDSTPTPTPAPTVTPTPTPEPTETPTPETTETTIKTGSGLDNIFTLFTDYKVGILIICTLIIMVVIGIAIMKRKR